LFDIKNFEKLYSSSAVFSLLAIYKIEVFLFNNLFST
jgi:hypothetical protein